MTISRKLQGSVNDRSNVLLFLHQRFYWPLAQNNTPMHHLISVQIYMSKSKNSAQSNAALLFFSIFGCVTKPIVKKECILIQGEI